MQEPQVSSLIWEDPLEKQMATHSHVLVWRIPWTEEPGRQQPMGSQRVRCDWSNLARTSILAWKIPWTEEPGGLQSMGSQRVGHNFTTTMLHTELGAFTTIISLLHLHHCRAVRVLPLLLRLWEITWFVQDDATGRWQAGLVPPSLIPRSLLYTTQWEWRELIHQNSAVWGGLLVANALLSPRDAWRWEMVVNPWV